MDLWEEYWKVSAEAIVYSAVFLHPSLQDFNEDVAKLARRKKVSEPVVRVAVSLAANPREIDVPAARARKDELTQMLLEHYLPVALNLAIEKARQTGEDFAEYMGVATETLRNAIPRWQKGKAPFANFANRRVKWSFYDEFRRGGWHLAAELGDGLYCSSQDGSEYDDLMWAIRRLPVEQAEIILRSMRLGQTTSEIAEVMHKSWNWVNEQGSVAMATLKELLTRRAEDDD